MTFSYIDNFLFGLGSMFLPIAPFSLLLIVVFFALFKTSKKIKICFFISVIFCYSLMAFWLFDLNNKICKNFLLLELDSCQIIIGNNEEPNSIFDLNRFFIEIKRDNKNKENSILLEKKGLSFDSKKESFYIEIPLNIKLKDNYSIILLEREQTVIKNKITSFLNYEDLK